MKIKAIKQYLLSADRRLKIVKLISFQRDEFERKSFRVLNLEVKGRIKMDSINLGNPEAQNDLGIVVIENLSWTDYIENRVFKAWEFSICLERNTLHNNDWASKRNIYKTCLVPIL